jgi:hypothetical protein
MISIEPSRSGHPVLRKNGRYLASSVDPVRDAEKWLESVGERLSDVPAIVVLGLGCGYHARALLRRKPDLRVVLVESDPEVAKHACEFIPEIAVEMICAEPDWTKLLDHAALRTITSGLFRVVRHPSSCQADSAYYDRAEALLLSHDRLGFFLQLRDRPELLRAMLMDRLDSLPQQPVSVKSVLSVLRPTGLGVSERELLLWKILGELVK